MSNSYHLPDRLYDSAGQMRRAGFEFEVGNLPVIGTAEALQDALGGELEVVTPFEAVLRDSTLGELKIERDAQLLKSVRYRRWLARLGVDFSPGSVGHELERDLDSASAGLVPCEVVTEPIPLRELDKLDALVGTLGALGAEGTQDSPVYAFGMHLNPSVPDESADTLRAYIQSFLLLSEWITSISDIDVTRRFLTKYIDPYPQDYIELLLNPDYRPNMDQLINDYMHHNPTRNRALDMLPILYGIDAERVLAGLPEEERALVSARPAFHYRLPDCKINEPGWSPTLAWNQWVCIDKLAGKPALLRELMEAWCQNQKRYTLAPGSRWIVRLTHLLAKRYFGV